ncbi:Hypothetical protein ETEE_1059 [Edwardsiella anguillarum ET080813]|uniref:Uncharacterized protein n=1 Tax=Edwardsiella anguillarum ET080813 TaxID=667120 RepID=A0A076LPG6_9GAMM|nr:Hypothetical protein ETEE_1059 [Edwardsiella anguillarum ET080813]
MGKHKIICANFYAVYFMQNGCKSAQNILYAPQYFIVSFGLARSLAFRLRR